MWRQARKDQSASELVIGADGLHSTIRKLVRAPLTYPETYAGFAAWRGAIPRNPVSSVTFEFLAGQLFKFLGQNSYMICHANRTDEGDFSPEAQLINRVLYQDVAERSADEAAIFMNASGRRHERTVLQGSADPSTRDRVRVPLVARVAAPFAEIVPVMTKPVFTKVSDFVCGKASFYDSHLVLVGDALATHCPHAGKATDQAAIHCLELPNVWRGKKSLAS